MDVETSAHVIKMTQASQSLPNQGIEPTRRSVRLMLTLIVIAYSHLFQKKSKISCKTNRSALAVKGQTPEILCKKA